MNKLFYIRKIFVLNFFQFLCVQNLWAALNCIAGPPFGLKKTFHPSDSYHLTDFFKVCSVKLISKSYLLNIFIGFEKQSLSLVSKNFKYIKTLFKENHKLKVFLLKLNYEINWVTTLVYMKTTLNLIVKQCLKTNILI